MRCVAIIFYQLRSNVLLNAQRLGPAADGAALYTPGLSERRNGSSLFYNSDNLGNLWSVEDSTGQAEAGAYLFTGFGAPTYTGSGSGSASPLKYGGANGCQTDGDTGLVLMGHRYYDTRIGRFISQDPVGDGDNWYAYADNSPTNEVDPLGLYVYRDPTMAGSAGDPSQFDHSGSISDGSDGTWDQYQSDGKGGWTYLNTVVHGGAWGSMNGPMSGASPGRGMFAADTSLDGTPVDLQTAKDLAGANDGTAGSLSKPGNPLKSVEDAIQAAKKWLGNLGKHVVNKDGDNVFMNKEGTKKLRFDIKNPSPHESPHAHIEELINGKWRGVGQIYPRDVPPR